MENPQQPAQAVQPQEQPRGGNQQGSQQQRPQGSQQQGPQGNQQQGPQGSQSDKGRGEAQSLLNNLKLKTLPSVQGHLDAARRSPGSKIDANAFSQKIELGALGNHGRGEHPVSGKSDAALQQAQAVQRQLADLDREIADADNSGGGQGDQQGRH